MWDRFWISWFRNAFWWMVTLFSIIVGAIGGAYAMAYRFAKQEKERPGYTSRYFKGWLNSK